MPDPITPDDLRSLADRCSDVSHEEPALMAHSLRAAADQIEHLNAEIVELRNELMSAITETERNEDA
jgi:hypothetical protein